MSHGLPWSLSHIMKSMSEVPPNMPSSSIIFKNCHFVRHLKVSPLNGRRPLNRKRPCLERWDANIQSYDSFWFGSKNKVRWFVKFFVWFTIFQLSKEQEERRSSLTNQSFLPSNLFALGQLTGAGGAGGVPQQVGKTEEKSEWFQLFADLDPLANPDSVGRKEGWDGGC